MFDEPQDIDLNALGTFEGADAPPKPAEKPDPEPQPKAGTDPAPKPEPKADPPKDPEPDPAGDPDGEEDFDDLTADDIEGIVAKAVKTAAKELRDEPDPDDDETPQEVKDLRAENARLKAENEQRAKAAEEREQQDAISALEHSIASTVGKYKMTPEETKATIVYMQGNPDLVSGGMGFEEAATRRLPHLADRLRTSPTPQTPRGGDGSDGILGAPGAAGPAAPKPWKHTVTRDGGYNDISEHMLATGEAASLGKYT